MKKGEMTLPFFEMLENNRIVVFIQLFQMLQELFWYSKQRQ